MQDNSQTSTTTALSQRIAELEAENDKLKSNLRWSIWLCSLSSSTVVALFVLFTTLKFISNKSEISTSVLYIPVGFAMLLVSFSAFIISRKFEQKKLTGTDIRDEIVTAVIAFFVVGLGTLVTSFFW